MDASIASRPVPIPPSAAQRAEAPVIPQAVKTELAQPDKSVPALRDTEGGRMDGRENRAAAEAQRRKINFSVDIDNETYDLILKAVYSDNGDLVQQLPPEAVLQLRAYVRDEMNPKIIEPIAPEWSEVLDQKK